MYQEPALRVLTKDCPAVAQKVGGGGGWTQLELTDALAASCDSFICSRDSFHFQITASPISFSLWS